MVLSKKRGNVHTVMFMEESDMKYKKALPLNETERDMLYQLQLFYDSAKRTDNYDEYNAMVLFANCVFGLNRHVGILHGMITLFEEV